MIPLEELEKVRASFPCIFFRLSSAECALARYGKGLPIKEAITNTVESVAKGLERRKNILPSLKLAPVEEVVDELVDTYITSGLANIADEVFCFGLLKTERGYVCGTQDLWIRKSYRELISYMFEMAEDSNGCLCYVASLLIQENIRDLDVCED